jgi:glucose-6-phosphate 1-dehydrogenase
VTDPAPDAHLFVIIGATGDLTRRKLLPALFHLVEDSRRSIVVLGSATTDQDDAGFRKTARSALEDAGFDEPRVRSWCDERVHYHRLDRNGDYHSLADRIAELERDHGLSGNRIFYLALPPRIFPGAITGLGEAGLALSSGWTRLVIEKPFGRDLDSARTLNEAVHRHFDESQIYRIDHYLGKETVQNLLVFRFTNPIFEANWNRDRIDRIEITVAESLGVGTRAGYYDQAGAVRDMIQSHLAQVMTLVAMESPASLDADAIRTEKIKVLRSVRSVPLDAVRVGQYTAGRTEADAIPDYRSHEGVAADSTTPTYAALRLYVDNWRWQGVPFLLRTGKAMAERLTQVAVVFRPPPVCLFHECPDDCVAHSDVLTLILQPNEGFRLQIEVKDPGESAGVRTIPLHFDYTEEFGEIPDAYETLLRDVMEGDQTLFVHAAEVEESWRLFTPVVEADLDVEHYPAGSWGPGGARELLGDAEWVTGG